MNDIIQVKQECFDEPYCEIGNICKQLQEKEKECEELNKQLVSFMSGDYCVKGCSLKKQLDQIKAEKDMLQQESDNWEQLVLFADKQIDEMQEEINLLQQYKKSKQASYESMQVEWNKAVLQNKDLLKQKLLGLKSKPAAMCEQNKELIEDNLNISKENKQLKATLIEIKKIAENFCNACQEFELTKKGKTCMYCNYGKILQKIKEVIPNGN